MIKQLQRCCIAPQCGSLSVFGTASFVYLCIWELDQHRFCIPVQLFFDRTCSPSNKSGTVCFQLCCSSRFLLNHWRTTPVVIAVFSISLLSRVFMLLSCIGQRSLSNSGVLEGLLNLLDSLLSPLQKPQAASHHRTEGRETSLAEL